MDPWVFVCIYLITIDEKLCVLRRIFEKNVNERELFCPRLNFKIKIELSS